MTDMEAICDRIKKTRKRLNLTLSSLAEKTGFSVSYLSKVERNQGNLSLDVFLKLCAVFDMDIEEFLSFSADEDIVHVRNGENRVIYQKEGLLKYELITSGSKKTLKGLRVTLYPGKKYKISMPHTTDELGYILEGEMTFVIIDKNEKNTQYHLKSGDSFYLYAGLKHALKCCGTKPCVSVWSYSSPPCFALTDYFH
ncbi:MAG: XRE family transcriptional regulator [Synergistaceae bacterium]|jgi:transcriptional regulator with XRE-family HTH domain|nr:XRE family transcriptional regulator [Synergistaceae bacterium]